MTFLGGPPQKPSPTAQNEMLGYKVQAIVVESFYGDCFENSVDVCGRTVCFAGRNLAPPVTLEIIEVLPIITNGSEVDTHGCSSVGNTAGYVTYNSWSAFHPVGSPMFDQIHDQMTGGQDGGPQHPFRKGEGEALGCATMIDGTEVPIPTTWDAGAGFWAAGKQDENSPPNPFACPPDPIILCPVAIGGVPIYGPTGAQRTKTHEWCCLSSGQAAHAKSVHSCRCAPKPL